jgi:5-formyltetrahydrofolate cyclo-ligase
MKKKIDYPPKLFELKKNFRTAALRARDALSEQQRKLKSSIIQDRVYSMPVVQAASSFFIYVSFASEVETHSLIRLLLGEGKHVSVPRVDRASKHMTASLIKSIEHDLTPGCFGILEPAPGCLRAVKAKSIDVVIVPGVAFTTDGFRIGYGGGYYDRFLKKCPAVSIGIAFDTQVVDHIPCDVQWDIPLDYVVTESRVIQPIPLSSGGGAQQQGHIR